RTFDITADRDEVTVALLGIDAATASDVGRQSLAARLKGRSVTLKLEPLQSRDPEGRLLAWAYLDDTNCVNIELVRDGLARTDTRRASTFRAVLDAAQTDARKHRRGLWATGTTTTTTTTRS